MVYLKRSKYSKNSQAIRRLICKGARLCVYNAKANQKAIDTMLSKCKTLFEIPAARCKPPHHFILKRKELQFEVRRVLFAMKEIYFGRALEIQEITAKQDDMPIEIFFTELAIIYKRTFENLRALTAEFAIVLQHWQNLLRDFLF